MEILKICLLLFSGALNVYPSTTNKPPVPWRSNTRKVNSLPDDLKNCFCYPDGQLPTVQQLLDSQNNGQERLVVYLYKNGVTNEIKMYTPNANKQLLIPDIPYEAGDGLVTVTTENLNTLLYNNPYKIKVYNDHIETLVPKVTDSFAIGLNTGAIEHIYPNSDNYLNPNNNYKGNEYNLAKNIIIANGPNGDINEPQKGLINIPNNGFIEQYDLNTNNLTPEQYWMGNNYPYIKPEDPKAIPLNPQATPDPQAIPINSQATPGNPQAIPLNPESNLDNAQVLPEDPLAVPLDLQYSPYKLQATPIDSQSLLPDAQVFPDNSQNYPGNPPVTPGNLQVFPGSYVGGLDQHVVYAFQGEQGSNKSPQDSHDVSSQYVTFNVWFNQQMKRFQNIHLPSDIKTIDSNVLRILVQKTFYENNIYVSADGVITDAKGVVIDASNLELRPLLLGETFSHQILQNAHTVIKLPKHRPYLEGILVTLVSPPQILGIIPLGKTYLPETSYMAQSLAGLNANGSKIYINSDANSESYSTAAKGPYTLAYKETYAGPTSYHAYSGSNKVQIPGNLNLESYSNAVPVAYPYSNGIKKPQVDLSEQNYWSSGPYYTVSKLPYPTANWNPSELAQLLGQRRKMSGAKIEHHYEPPIKNKKKGKGPKKATEAKRGGTEEVTTVEPFLSINSTQSGRRFPAPSLKGVMKTLLYLLNDLPSRRGLNSTDIDIVSESESESDGGDPDFRIIGGSAATGSGTPVSNKGRSGSTEYA